MNSLRLLWDDHSRSRKYGVKKKLDLMAIVFLGRGTSSGLFV
jgi:hypothetical protein